MKGKMKTLLLGFLLFTLCLGFTGSKAFAFSDDFEDGVLLDDWNKGGRQGGTGSVSLVDRHGSQVAQVYHKGWSEIRLEHMFSYDPGLHFDFDMETKVVAKTDRIGYRADANSGVRFTFLDDWNSPLGSVRLLSATYSLPDSDNYRFFGVLSG